MGGALCGKGSHWKQHVQMQLARLSPKSLLPAACALQFTKPRLQLEVTTGCQVPAGLGPWPAGYERVTGYDDLPGTLQVGAG